MCKTRIFIRFDFSKYEFNSLTLTSQEHQTAKKARWKDGKTESRQLPFCRFAVLPFIQKEYAS